MPPNDMTNVERKRVRWEVYEQVMAICGFAKGRVRPFDLSGQRFGRLVVAEYLGPYCIEGKPTGAAWLCLCDCGNEKIVRSGSLLHGNTRTCGCLLRERQTMLQK